MDFWCSLHKVMVTDWCDQCEAQTDVLTRRKMDNAIRRGHGLPEVPLPNRCGCRGIVHTCNQIT